MDSFDISDKEECVFQIDEDTQLIAHKTADGHSVFYLMTEEEYVTFHDLNSFVYDLKNGVETYTISDDDSVVVVNLEQYDMIKKAVELVKESV